jgi:hypothetical protein
LIDGEVDFPPLKMPEEQGKGKVGVGGNSGVDDKSMEISVETSTPEIKTEISEEISKQPEIVEIPTESLQENSLEISKPEISKEISKTEKLQVRELEDTPFVDDDQDSSSAEVVVPFFGPISNVFQGHF